MGVATGSEREKNVSKKKEAKQKAPEDEVIEVFIAAQSGGRLKVKPCEGDTEEEAADRQAILDALSGVTPTGGEKN